MEILLEGKCEACKADAPLVTADEKKNLCRKFPVGISLRLMA